MRSNSGGGRKAEGKRTNAKTTINAPFGHRGDGGLRERFEGQSRIQHLQTHRIYTNTHIRSIVVSKGDAAMGKAEGGRQPRTIHEQESAVFDATHLHPALPQVSAIDLT